MCRRLRAAPRRGGRGRARARPAAGAGAGTGTPARGGSRRARPARRARMFAEPVCEALVQLCACRLRQASLRRVANQQVPEPVGVLTLVVARAPDERALCVRAQPGGSRFASPREQASARRRDERHALRWRHVAAPSLGRVELIEPGRQECMDCGRHRHVARRGVPQQTDHLLDEQRVALGGFADLLLERRRERSIRGDPLISVSVSRRRALPARQLSRSGDGRPSLDAAPGARRAQCSRAGAEHRGKSVVTCSISSRKAGSPH